MKSNSWRFLDLIKKYFDYFFLLKSSCFDNRKRYYGGKVVCQIDCFYFSHANSQIDMVIKNTGKQRQKKRFNIHIVLKSLPNVVTAHLEMVLLDGRIVSITRYDSFHRNVIKKNQTNQKSKEKHAFFLLSVKKNGHGRGNNSGGEGGSCRADKM